MGIMVYGPGGLWLVDNPILRLNPTQPKPGARLINLTNETTTIDRPLETPPAEHRKKSNLPKRTKSF
jgi:hypothetical protein